MFRDFLPFSLMVTHLWTPRYSERIPHNNNVHYGGLHYSSERSLITHHIWLPLWSKSVIVARFQCTPHRIGGFKSTVPRLRNTGSTVCRANASPTLRCIGLHWTPLLGGCGIPMPSARSQVWFPAMTTAFQWKQNAENAHVLRFRCTLTNKKNK